MANNGLNEKDRWALNIFWCYGEGMINKEEFIDCIDKIKYKITEDKNEKPR